MMNRGERGGQSWVDKVVNDISRNANSEKVATAHTLPNYGLYTQN